MLSVNCGVTGRLVSIPKVGAALISESVDVDGPQMLTIIADEISNTSETRKVGNFEQPANFEQVVHFQIVQMPHNARKFHFRYPSYCFAVWRSTGIRV